MHLLALLHGSWIARLRTRLSSDEGWADLIILLAIVVAAGLTAAAILAGDWAGIGNALFNTVSAYVDAGGGD